MGARRRAPAARTARGGETLGRDQVVDAAVAMVRQGGPDSLTVRGLAARLSVAVTSIYWHVGDKDAVLDAVADRVISGFTRRTVRGADPEARVRATARSLRRALLEQAELVALVHRQGRSAELLQPARLAMVRELAMGGVPPERVAVAAQAVLNHVIGSVLLDRQVARQPHQRDTAEALWRPEDVDGLADAERLFAGLTHPVDDDALFEHSLAVLVAAAMATGP